MRQGTANKTEGDRLVRFIGTKGINPFVKPELAEVIKTPIRFYVPTGGLAYGYEATVLADLCDAVLEARKTVKLNYQQDHIAARCEILVRSFARVGIIALVDEATGYQYDRPAWMDDMRRDSERSLIGCDNSSIYATGPSYDANPPHMFWRECDDEDARNARARLIDRLCGIGAMTHDD